MGSEATDETAMEGLLSRREFLRAGMPTGSVTFTATDCLFNTTSREVAESGFRSL